MEINGYRRSKRIYVQTEDLDKWKELMDERKIILTLEDYKRCLEFAFKITYSGHTTTDFGTARQRGKLKAISDWTQGALGEVAFQKFLKTKFEIKVDLDFEVHGVIVGQDITQVQKGRVLNPPRIRVSIKSGKPNGCYLIVPEKEVDLHERRSEYYVFVRVDFPEDHLIRALKDHPTIESMNLNIPDLGQINSFICGYVSVKELDKVRSIPKVNFEGYRYVKGVGSIYNQYEDWKKFVEIL